MERYTLLRTVARSILVCWRWGRNSLFWAYRARAIGRYLTSHQIRKLQIGAGPNLLDGWLNTDKYPASRGVVFLNAAKRFPFGDSTFDYVFSEHLIEHLAYDQGQYMLRECFRVLKPGGRIRIATPDLETLIGLYASQKSSLQQRYIRWIVDQFLPQIGIYRESFVINNAFRSWDHQFLYDRVTLQSALEKTGFAEITRQPVGASQDDVFRGIESHGLAAGDEEMNRFETMVLEAKRPL